MSAILAYSEPGSAAQALAGAGGQLAADGTADRRWQRLSDVLMLTGDPDSPAGVLPSLGLLPHELRVAPADITALAVGQAADIVLIDARRDLMHAKGLFRALRGAGFELPMLAIVAEGGWAAVTADWGADDVILHTAGPGEVEARLRLAVGRRTAADPAPAGEIRSGDLVIDEASYLVRLRGRTLDLTFKEFELLKFLAQHPARVFTRSQLLQEVWGYDYFGGTRTVDVHVRRLRAKLGAEYELLIGTVRNVGYRFVPAPAKPDSRRKPPGATDQPGRSAARRDAAPAQPGRGAASARSRAGGPGDSGGSPARSHAGGPAGSGGVPGRADGGPPRGGRRARAGGNGREISPAPARR